MVVGHEQRQKEQGEATQSSRGSLALPVPWFQTPCIQSCESTNSHCVIPHYGYVLLWQLWQANVAKQKIADSVFKKYTKEVLLIFNYIKDFPEQKASHLYAHPGISCPCVTHDDSVSLFPVSILKRNMTTEMTLLVLCLPLSYTECQRQLTDFIPTERQRLGGMGQACSLL